MESDELARFCKCIGPHAHQRMRCSFSVERWLKQPAGPMRCDSTAKVSSSSGVTSSKVELLHAVVEVVEVGLQSLVLVVGLGAQEILGPGHEGGGDLRCWGPCADPVRP